MYAICIHIHIHIDIHIYTYTYTYTYTYIYIYKHPEVDRTSGISKKKVSQNTLDRIPKWLKNPGR